MARSRQNPQHNRDNMERNRQRGNNAGNMEVAREIVPQEGQPNRNAQRNSRENLNRDSRNNRNN